MSDRIRPIIYLLVVIAAPMLPEAWMIALQASFGGFALGAWVERTFVATIRF